MALGATQPLTEMSTRSIFWGYRRPVRKADNLPPSCAVVTKSGNLNFLEPSGPVTGLLYLYQSSSFGERDMASNMPPLIHLLYEII